MNMLKKTYLVGALITLGTTAFAAGTNFPSTGATTVVTPAQCSAIQENVRVGLSKDVAGSYECSATNAAFATGSWKGRGKMYSVHSGGSVVLETDNGGKYTDAASVETDTGAETSRLLAIADSSISN